MTRYVAASSIAEALQVLREHPGARPCHGGTDLVVQARTGKRTLPTVICGIDRVDELTALQVGPHEVRIGAGVTHAQLLASEPIRALFPALCDAAALIGSPATRNLGTIGGNIANASPAADLVGPLVVLGAEAVVASIDGERRLPIGQIATGPGATTIGADELVTEVIVPRPEHHSASAYLRLGFRAAMEIAVVGAAVAVALDDDGVITDARLALTAVAPTVLAVEVASLVAGQVLDQARRQQIADRAKGAISPIDDVRASADYRRRVIGTYTLRAFDTATSRARREA